MLKQLHVEWEQWIVSDSDSESDLT